MCKVAVNPRPSRVSIVHTSFGTFKVTNDHFVSTVFGQMCWANKGEVVFTCQVSEFKGSYVENNPAVQPV